jgi:DNA mismatch repair protein MutS2
MVYPSDIESKLGFDTIRQRLQGYCLSSLGVRLVDRIHFTHDFDALEPLLKQCLEFVQIIERGDTFPSSHYFDPAELFSKAMAEGSYLDEPDFLQLAYSMGTIITCRDYFIKNQEQCPFLFKLTYPVTLTNKLILRINQIIDEHARVRDSSSAELARIRKRLREEQSRSRKLIDQIYRFAVEQNWVPEGALPTIRGGRLVLPVLAEHKRRMKGFILDESATGQTVYMEPAEVLEANNEIRDLEYAEKREVIIILKLLTDDLRANLPELTRAYEFLSWIDFTRAKARLAVELDANLPVLSPRPFLQWISARHPLLSISLKGKRELVPLSIDLQDDFRMLIVSGPNAGGKSVCLKTVGLLQYMLQCGLLIPVHPDSKAGIFQNIFIDIGDQQSIENDLSTYSSHLKNLTYFIQFGNEDTLVLMDELGSGTDPDFGGAIAEAILSSLLNKKIWGVATTHYYNLKLFAEQNRGVRNASMRFDEQNLVPLYILDIGKPGSSFALEIAQKTGIPDDTLKLARKLAGEELVGLETLVRNLEKERVELSNQQHELVKKNVELEELLTRYHTLTNDVEKKKKQILEKAKEEARQLLVSTNREIEKTIRHIRENQAQKKETIKVRQSLQDLAKKVSIPEPAKLIVKSTPIAPGERVRIIGQEGSGVVISIKGKSALVQFGELKSKVDISKLETVAGSQPNQGITKSRTTGFDLAGKRSNYSNILNVRGMRAEEVLPKLQQFMDTSILLGQGDVRILHGKGEGVLRKVIREELKKYKEVASFSDEHVDRGGDGITVVILK